MDRLAHKVGVYVPRSELVPEAAQELARRYGGCTALPGRGYWVSADGHLVADPTTYVFAYCASAPDAQELATWGENLARTWHEECVAVEVDGALLLCYVRETARETA